MTIDPVPTTRLNRPIVIDVAIDASDAERMAVFYETLLGYERAFERPGHVYLIDPSGLGPHIYIQQVPEPRVDKNRLHLDIVVPSLGEAANHAISLGATRVDERRTAYTWFVVLADPEGNLFCLVDLATWEQSKPPWWQHGTRA
ncbi:MAG TPA: VOC family protein [Acidimicrobiales bacterium]|jgi:4a-hydroxytetrahydrobiopterin dehydratase|nr:VOC family protein [Acidimicrobiales bacterium]